MSGFMSLTSCRFLEQQGFFRKKSLKEALLWAKQDSARVADSLKKSGFVIKTGVETLPDSGQQIPIKIFPEKNQLKKYHIIVGSFSSIENAKLRSGEYLSNGYKADLLTTISSSGSKIVLVSVKSFDSSSDANKYLKEFQLIHDSTAWIYLKN